MYFYWHIVLVNPIVTLLLPECQRYRMFNLHWGIRIPNLKLKVDS
jgi:hypothetical protein